MENLYNHSATDDNYSSANGILSIVLELCHPKSVLDIGCGVGAWLKYFDDHNITDYLGVDGNYVDLNKLKISREKFISADLRKPFDLQRKFDLVMSLEVAEHLPEQVADIFIETLVNHGDTILFSAALPGQGGQNHLNEKWPEYWKEKFSKHNYYFEDVIRFRVWDDENIRWWYRQNIFLVRKGTGIIKGQPLSLIHPKLHLLNLRKLQDAIYRLEKIQEGESGVRVGLTILLKSILKKVGIVLTNKKKSGNNP